MKCQRVGPELQQSVSKVLYDYNNNKNGRKALIAAEYSGVQVALAKNFQMGVTNKTTEFLQMNPMGKVPVLETPDGCIFESNAIARYVIKFSRGFQAHIEQWIDFATLEIDANIIKWVAPRFGYGPYLAAAEEAAITALKRAFGALNSHLLLNTYLVGHAVTLADIIMTCNLYVGFSAILIKSFTSEFPHVERYFWTMVNQPNFRKVLGEVKQAESVPPVPSQKKPSQPNESAKPKEAKKEPKKEPPKPKVEKPVEEEEEAPKPKAKNPLDLLPPSFWDMYDPEGYSLWFCDYKYNDENTVSFVTLNMKVKGLWLFRGNEIPQFVVKKCYDMELYDWTKVDITDEVQKKRVNAMIEDQEPFEGEALLDAKCFK
ncbi:Elongation factor 1-gamma [Canna indica]|uniref:Elongation factor 1-gamma n=1 Tax=Canna indica TaxID=4628 RepID=A0AAQ3KQ75_9LILI|nr:Elongation factor 1-gamma [Canna indica]